MNLDLTGHVAVVTGGGSDIGLGFAAGLVGAGATVTIAGRTASRIEAAAEELNRSAPGSGRARPVVCDVAEEQSVIDLMNEVVGAQGRLDSCFANAAVDGPYRGLLETTVADFREVLAVNLDGAFVTLREAARHMVALGNGGSLVATSSIGARKGMPLQYPYAASKGALMSMIYGMAVEFARHGIRANSVLPGFVDTPMTHASLQTEPANKRILPRVPARRWGTGSDFAGVAVYLASEASAFHTGDTLVIDGGFDIF